MSSTFTSPLTNQTYEVVPTDKNGWFRFEIRKDGRMVQFALTEENVAKQVAHYEGVDDGWYCLPRD